MPGYFRQRVRSARHGLERSNFFASAGWKRIRQRRAKSKRIWNRKREWEREPERTFGSGSESLLFYDQTGFRGSSTAITSNSSNLRFARRPGSVEVRGGTWELCDQSGRCATVRQNVSNLSQIGLGNNLRSATLIDDGYGNNNNNGNGYGRNRRNPYNGGGYSR